MLVKSSLINMAILIILAITLISCSNNNSNSAINDTELKRITSSASLEVKVGQMLMTTVPSTYISDSFSIAVKNYHLGGVLLYQPNITDSAQLVRLTDQIQKKSGNLSMFIALDQEGGRVSRIKDITKMPGHMAVGAAHDTQLAYDVAKTMGEELMACGINTDFAPVLDVLSNPDNAEIAARSFSSEPNEVADMGNAFIRGLNETGIIATAKHFPGHGGTDMDSHYDLPVVNADSELLESRDIIPFENAIDGGVDMIMTAHVAYPALDKTEILDYNTGKKMYYPATLSEKILTDLLRKKLGFKGVIVTDSMQMKAILDYFGPQENAVVKAVKAGADIIIVQTELDKVYSELIEAVKNGDISEKRIDESFKRIISLKLEKGILEVENGKLVSGKSIRAPVEEKLNNLNKVIDNSEHKDVQRKAFESALTLVKNDQGLLPLKQGNVPKTTFFAPSEEAAASISTAVLELFGGSNLENAGIKISVYNKQKKLTQEHKAAIDKSSVVLLFTYSNGPISRSPDKYWGAGFAKETADYASSGNIPLVAIALGDPFDITYMPDVKAYMCIYGNEGQKDIEACIKAAFGLVNPEGKLPVDILDREKKNVIFKRGYGLQY